MLSWNLNIKKVSWDPPVSDATFLDKGGHVTIHCREEAKEEEEVLDIPRRKLGVKAEQGKVEVLPLSNYYIVLGEEMYWKLHPKWLGSNDSVKLNTLPLWKIDDEVSFCLFATKKITSLKGLSVCLSAFLSVCLSQKIGTFQEGFSLSP